MAADFSGIAEKLKRSHENIQNLKVEITDFFNASRYPEIPHDDADLILEAIAYHKQLVIPPRFAVLSGEIIHHLRSILDHVVWQFSSLQYRAKHFRKIQFPICKSRPIDEKSRASYEGKILGITDPEILDLIEKFQPYNSQDPLDDPLVILHDMDIADKHREILVCSSIGGMDFPIAMRDVVENYQCAHPELNSAQVAFQFKSHGKLVPQIAFKDFGRREIEPVIPALTELLNEVVIVVKACSTHIK
jgi:hypothetical protein